MGHEQCETQLTCVPYVENAPFSTDPQFFLHSLHCCVRQAGKSCRVGGDGEQLAKDRLAVLVRGFSECNGHSGFSFHTG